MSASISSVGATAHGLRLAARTVAAGGVIAYPTEAVYGLGCDPLDADAVHRILAIKGRPQHKGLILIAANFNALLPFVVPLEAGRMAEILASWPGPNTWLLPARPEAPRWLTGAHETLAVRVPGHPVARSLCAAWARDGGGALVSTSANQAARPPARTALQVRRWLESGPDLILNAPCGSSRRPSTIRDGQTGRLLRS
jgi:L-threonylcarbamoyladenylate synthase